MLMHDGDKKWIAETIRLYDQRYPTGEDSIALCVVSAKQEQRDLALERKISSKTGVVSSSDVGRRLSVTMPGKLYWILKRKYPQIFTRDINWFKRNFPMFVVSR